MNHPTIQVGIMKVDVTGQDAPTLSLLTERATKTFTSALHREARIDVRSFSFNGPNLTPGDHGYQALDFVQIGINEKTERRLAFLLLVTEVEIAAASFSYLLALPSQLTNVAIISTRRLADRGSPEASDNDLLSDRLATLMLHCFGRLLNLDYTAGNERNYLYPIRLPTDLDGMNRFDEGQYVTIATNLPREANNHFSSDNRFSFVARQIAGNLPRIFRGALRANPLRIATKLPTMIATALSVIIVLIFGSETWDFASSVSSGQLTVFIVASFAAASFVLYQAFSFRLVATRHGNTSESSVVTAAATYLALLFTLAVLFVALALVMYGVVLFVFPDPLMSTWTSDQDGSTVGAHFRLVLFLAAVGILSGSLGGSADSRSVVRNVLFATDET
jgi:hypothetical protein